MTEDNQKHMTPEIRFKGFSDDWEQRKLGELFKEAKRPIKLSDNDTYQLVTVKRKNGGIVSRGYFEGKDILVKNYFELKAGDYLISKRQVVHGANGIVPEELDGAIVSNEYLVSMGSKIMTSKYLSIVSSLPQMYKKFFLSSYGIDIEKLVFNVEDWKKRSLLVPNIIEQNSITKIIDQFSTTIALHQQKYELLLKLKQAYLNLLFPEKNEKVPQVRFADFQDNWEQRKLDDVFSERSERSGEGELISVTINSGVIRASELDRKDNSSNNKSNYKKVEVGDIAYNSMRMWQGASGYSPYNGILSPAYTVIIPKEGIDSKFFAYDFKRYDMIQTFKRNSQGLTSDTWNLKFPTLKSIKVMVPCIEEQKKISSFFERFDMTITLHQQKIESLKFLKQAYLQKMFV